MLPYMCVPSMDGEEIAAAGETSAAHLRASSNGAGTSAGEDKDNRWSSSTTITAIDLHIASTIFYIHKKTIGRTVVRITEVII